jgi:hypothetical protein
MEEIKELGLIPFQPILSTFQLNQQLQTEAIIQSPLCNKNLHLETISSFTLSDKQVQSVNRLQNLLDESQNFIPHDKSASENVKRIGNEAYYSFLQEDTINLGEIIRESEFE